MTDEEREEVSVVTDEEREGEGDESKEEEETNRCEGRGMLVSIRTTA